MTEREELVVEIARELYDRFVMGGWEPQDAYSQIEGWLAIEREAGRVEGREDKNVVKLSVPEHLRTGKVYEALQEQTKERAESSDTLPKKEK